MTFSEVLGIIVATAVTVILRWAANRWPGAERSGSRRRPRRRK